MSIRVLIVDDSNLFRQGLDALLSANPDYQIVGQSPVCKDVVQTALRLQPQIVVMDPVRQGFNGLEIVEQLKRRLTHCKVVLLTIGKSEEYVRQALRNGIDGFVLKDASIEELYMALRYAMEGKKYLSPDVSSQVLKSYLNPSDMDPRVAKLESLTPRERSILQLIAEGRTNRTAAQFLSLSPKTVEKHRASVMQKLGLRNAVELTLMALEMGLIERPSVTGFMPPARSANQSLAA